jgi:hypothetical protein
MTYRNPKLLKLAQQAPHCFMCLNHNDGTVVAAHSNQVRDGKGTGIKAADFRIAYLCARCHHAIDCGMQAKQIKRDQWEQAHRSSIGWLFESGNVVVS